MLRNWFTSIAKQLRKESCEFLECHSIPPAPPPPSSRPGSHSDVTSKWSLVAARLGAGSFYSLESKEKRNLFDSEKCSLTSWLLGSRPKQSLQDLTHYLQLRVFPLEARCFNPGHLDKGWQNWTIIAFSAYRGKCPLQNLTWTIDLGYQMFQLNQTSFLWEKAFL